MLTKAVPFLRAVPRVQQARHMGYGVPANFKPIRQICEENKTHMNCMPVPEGSWQANYSARNTKWNLMLAASVAALAVTFGALWQTGCIYLHGAPPAYTDRMKK